MILLEIFSEENQALVPIIRSMVGSRLQAMFLAKIIQEHFRQNPITIQLDEPKTAKIKIRITIKNENPTTSNP